MIFIIKKKKKVKLKIIIIIIQKNLKKKKKLNDEDENEKEIRILLEKNIIHQTLEQKDFETLAPKEWLNEIINNYIKLLQNKINDNNNRNNNNNNHNNNNNNIIIMHSFFGQECIINPNIVMY